jgi:hypothetical protein
MTIDLRPFRPRQLRVLVWLLIWGQLLPIMVSTSQHWLRRYRLESFLAAAPQLNREVVLRGGRSNPDLKVGIRVAAVPVVTPSGTRVDLAHLESGRQALLFVSSCAPCSAGLVDQYDHLFRSRLDVKVIARIPSQQIAEARRRYGWRLPCYSDADDPRAAQE